MDALGQLVLHAAGSPWLLPLVFLFVVVDGIFPPVPSESVVIALAAIAASTGHPPMLLLGLAAALGAFLGDNITYEIGRRIGLQRLGWMRRPWFVKTVGRASAALDHRVSSAVLAARFVPGGRVGVNLVAGAGGIPRKVFRPLTLLSAVCWTGYTLAIGTVAGSWVSDHPVLGALIATGLGLVVGLLIDTVLGIVRRRREAVRRLSGQTTTEQPDLLDVSAG
jgi:membrane protein DedA with SNARE-associated domain